MRQATGEAGVAGRRLFMDLWPLRRSPAFRRLWLGSTLSSTGSQMTTFAVALQVYRFTHSSLAVGAVGLVAAVPAVTVGLLGGSIADSVDRRRLVLGTSSGLAGVSVLFAAQAFAGLRLLWLLYALVAVQAVLGSVNTPARRTFLARLLPAERVPAGAALNMLAMHLAVTTGPLLAGVVAATGGLKMCYVIDAASFGAALYGVAGLPPMPPLAAGTAAAAPPAGAGRGGARAHRAGPRAVGETLRAIRESPRAAGQSLRAIRESLGGVGDGLRFILGNRVLSGALLADMSATLLGMPFAVFPAINADRFGGSPQTYGLLMAAPAIGGLIGSALSGPLGRVSRHGRAMLIAGSVWGAGLAAFGLAGSLWLAVGALVVAGAADVTSVVFRTTIVQVATPDRYRGRASAAEYVVGVACPQLGNFRAGAVAALTSPATSAVSGGLATIAGAAVIGVALPAFVRYRTGAPTERHPEPEPAPAGAAP